MVMDKWTNADYWFEMGNEQAPAKADFVTLYIMSPDFLLCSLDNYYGHHRSPHNKGNYGSQQDYQWGQGFFLETTGWTLVVTLTVTLLA